MRRCFGMLLLALTALGQDPRPTGVFRARGPPRRNLRAGGGNGATENAVALGLLWLAGHQDDDGRWDCDGFQKHDLQDDRCDGAGAAGHDVGVTGLAVLAFLGAGHTDHGSAHSWNVLRALRFLVASQSEDGCFGPKGHAQFMYGHAIATLAICEAVAMTRDRYRKPAEDGVAFLLRAQNPGAGWRYAPRGGDSDTDVTAWCVAALRSGRLAGLDVPDRAFVDALAWIDKATDPAGRAGYTSVGTPASRTEAMARRFPAAKTESLTAAGIFTRILCGQDPRATEWIRRGAALCAAKPPVWNPDDGSIDMYYWYWGSLALFHAGGPRQWGEWNDRMREALLSGQHPRGSGSRSGSWDPIDAWGLESGGRVYSTALMTMCLEVYYRYDRAFFCPPPPPSPPGNR